MRKITALIFAVLFISCNALAAPFFYGGVSSGGDVAGPASATDGAVACFDGITGKLLKACAGGELLPDSGTVGNVLCSNGSDWESCDTLSISSLDMSGADYTKPFVVGLNPTLSEEGDCALDVTDSQLLCFVGGAVRVYGYKGDKSFVMKSPIDADDFLWFKAQSDITLVGVYCAAQGAAPSIAIKLQECDSAGANCADVGLDVTADGGEDFDVTPTDADIAANNWAKVLVNGAPTGTVTFLSCSLFYTLSRK